VYGIKTLFNWITLPGTLLYVIHLMSLEAARDLSIPDASGKLQFCFLCLNNREKRESAEKSTTSTDRKAGSIFEKHHGWTST